MTAAAVVDMMLDESTFSLVKYVSHLIPMLGLREMSMLLLQCLGECCVMTNA